MHVHETRFYIQCDKNLVLFKTTTSLHLGKMLYQNPYLWTACFYYKLVLIRGLYMVTVRLNAKAIDNLVVNIR